MSKTKILLLILAFVILTFGSFIWMIITWDRDTEESITGTLPKPTLALAQILPPEAPHADKRVTL